MEYRINELKDLFLNDKEFVDQVKRVCIDNWCETEKEYGINTEYFRNADLYLYEDREALLSYVLEDLELLINKGVLKF